LPLRAGFGLLDERTGGWGTEGGGGELGGEGLSVGGVRKKRGGERRKRRTVEKSKGIGCGDRHWGVQMAEERDPGEKGLLGVLLYSFSGGIRVESGEGARQRLTHR